MGYRRAKSTQGITNFQKKNFFGKRLRDHYPRALIQPVTVHPLVRICNARPFAPVEVTIGVCHEVNGKEVEGAMPWCARGRAATEISRELLRVAATLPN